MSVVRQHGENRFGTPVKESRFSACLDISLGVSMSPRVVGYNYWHIDLNAGCGHNAEANCDGSPVILAPTAGSLPIVNAIVGGGLADARFVSVAAYGDQA